MALSPCINIVDINKIMRLYACNARQSIRRLWRVSDYRLEHMAGRARHIGTASRQSSGILRRGKERRHGDIIEGGYGLPVSPGRGVAVRYIAYPMQSVFFW